MEREKGKKRRKKDETESVGDESEIKDVIDDESEEVGEKKRGKKSK